MNKPTCAVRGLVAPGAMCGSIITGDQFCGLKGQCQHQGPAPAIKVFQLDDYEWWAGATLEDCIKAARDACGDECFEGAEDDGCEVSAEGMQTKRIHLEDGRDPTFAEHLAVLIAEGTKFPCQFAAIDA